MLSLYVHIPFCIKKCRYCGFYSTPYEKGLAAEYLKGLRLEARQAHAAFPGKIIHSLYLGGGTPTVLDRQQLAELLDIINGHFSFSGSCEQTIEVNPATITEDTLRFLLRSGVNRLTVGIQSFSDYVLKGLGRSHSASQASDTIRLAQRCGFNNVGIDLIYGIPGLTDRLWADTLERAVMLGPQHISVYSLSLDEGSSFAQDARAGRFTLPDDERVAAQYDAAADALTAAGFEHYEISNFAKHGFACRHNVNYWKRGEYLGLGPAASSFLGSRRSVNIAEVREYTRRLRSGGSAVQEEETVSARQAAVEALMLGLRTTEGVLLSAYEQRFGPVSREAITRCCAKPAEAGLLVVEGGRIRLTRRGMLLSNEVIAGLI